MLRNCFVIASKVLRKCFEISCDAPLSTDRNYPVRALLGHMTGATPAWDLPFHRNFERLVLGCSDAVDSESGRIFQGVSRFAVFCTVPSFFFLLLLFFRARVLLYRIVKA